MPGSYGSRNQLCSEDYGGDRRSKKVSQFSLHSYFLHFISNKPVKTSTNTIFSDNLIVYGCKFPTIRHEYGRE